MIDEPAIFKLRYLPVDAWPPACQIQWHDAFAEQDLFNDNKPALYWRKASVKKTRKGFGGFLSWRLFDNRLEPEVSVADLVTCDHMKGFVAAMRASSYAPYTIFCHVQEVYDAARVMDPTQDWSWLKHAVNRLRASSRPQRTKLERLQPADRLERLGLALLEEAGTSQDLTRHKRALMVRDGLLIALLIRRPLRLKNMTELSLGDHLILHENSATLLFTADEMKGKRPLEAAFPQEYYEALQTYLTLYRPYLLTLTHEADHDTRQLNESGQNNALWISNEGKPMADLSIRNMIKRRTKAAFGTDMTPHLFRDASVTTLIRHAPESARLTRSILGHTTIDMTNAHYNQARMVETSRRHTDLIEGLIGIFTEEAC